MEIPKDIEKRITWKTVPGAQSEEHINGIKKIKPLTSDCEECGVVLTDQRTVSVTFHPNKGGISVKRCDVCKNVYNPATGLFDLHFKTGPNIIKKLLKKTRDDK